MEKRKSLNGMLPALSLHTGQPQRQRQRLGGRSRELGERVRMFTVPAKTHILRFLQASERKRQKEK